MLDFYAPCTRLSMGASIFVMNKQIKDQRSSILEGITTKFVLLKLGA